MSSAADSISGAWLGSIAALVTCVLSAFGGVYSELLLKKDGNLHSIHLQNALLYSWGVLFNGLALVLKDRHAIVEKGGLFSGYSFIVILLIIMMLKMSLWSMSAWSHELGTCGLTERLGTSGCCMQRFLPCEEEAAPGAGIKKRQRGTRAPGGRPQGRGHSGSARI